MDHSIGYAELAQRPRHNRGILTGILAFSLLAFASSTAQAKPTTPVDATVLENAISENLLRVREFAFIRKEAEKLGVRVYLFGGTAAAYAHYVKWDVLRKNGDSSYFEKRFDYDYSNIFRSTQDLDIVVDGTPDQTKALEGLLREKFKHVQGSKSLWEARPLRHKLADKDALLGDYDFLNQNSDSNSTGLVEITQPAHGDPVVRDLRD